MRITVNLLVMICTLSVFLTISAASTFPYYGGPWAGYSVFDHSNIKLYNVSSINGSWIVENAPPTTDWFTFGSQWIGIGGANSTNLIQIGTRSDHCTICGMNYYAFWEQVNSNNSRYVTTTNPTFLFPVKPGDKIIASISLIKGCQQAFTLLPCWQLNITDLNSNATNSFPVYFDPNRNSADWEEESLQSSNLCTTPICPLPKFWVAYFGPDYTNIKSDYADINSTIEPLGKFPELAKYYFGNSNATGFAHPSNLGSDNASFTIYEGLALHAGTIIPNTTQISSGQQALITDYADYPNGGSGNYTYHWLTKKLDLASGNFINISLSCCFIASGSKLTLMGSTQHGFYQFQLEVIDNLTGEVNFTNTVTINIGTNPPTSGINYTLIKSYIPLTVHNSQGSALAAGTQFAVTFNALNYSSTGLNANLSNICVAYDDKCITAWIQGNLSAGVNGGQFSYALNHTSDAIWVRAPSTIGAYSSSGNFSIIVFNRTINNYQDPQVLGANPTLWCALGCPSNHYAGVDNGALIFESYQNFLTPTSNDIVTSEGNGTIDGNWNVYTTCRSGCNVWAIPTSWTIDNGLIISSGNYGIIYSTQTFNASSNLTIDGLNPPYSLTSCSNNNGASSCSIGATPGSGFWYINPNAIQCNSYNTNTLSPNYGQCNSTSSYFLERYDFGATTEFGSCGWSSPSSGCSLPINIWYNAGTANTLLNLTLTSTLDLPSSPISQTITNGEYVLTTNYGFGTTLFNQPSYTNSTDSDRFAFGLTYSVSSSVSGLSGSTTFIPTVLSANYILERHPLPNGQQPQTTSGVPRTSYITATNYSITATTNKSENLFFRSLNPDAILRMIVSYIGDAPIVVNGTGSVNYTICSTPSTCLPSGTYAVTVNDITINYSETWPLIIVNPPSVSVTPANSILDHNQQIYLFANVLNGSGVFTYQWYNATSGNDILINNVTGPTYLLNATGSGTFKYNVLVSDVGTNNVTSVQSNNATVVVESALVANVTPSNSIIYSENSLTFVSAVSGGTGNFTYQWYNFSSRFFGVPLPNQTSSSLTLPFNSAGNFTYFLVVTDQGTTTSPRASTISLPVNVTVMGPRINFSITLASNLSNVITGQNILLSNTVVKGVPPFSYNYTVFQNGVKSTSGFTLSNNTINFSSSGVWDIYETVTDSSNSIARSNNVTISVMPASYNVIPSGAQYYLPLYITNNQSVPIAAGTQLMFKVNASYLASACINNGCNFANGNWIVVDTTTGARLYAWRESATTLWFKLNAPIAATSSDKNLALVFFPTSQYSATGYTGEASNLGTQDNGALVFNTYVSGNGFLNSVSNGGIGTAYDADVQANEGAWQSAGYYYNQNISTALQDNTGQLIYWGCGFIYVGGVAGGCPQYNTPPDLILPNASYAVFTVIPVSPSQVIGYENYGNRSVANTSYTAISYVGNKNLNGYMNFIWSRIRTVPSGGMLPSVSNGPMQVLPSQTPSVSLSTNQTSVSANQEVLFINTTSGGTPPYTYSYTVFHNGLQAVSGFTLTGNKVSFSSGGLWNVSETVTDSKNASSASNNVSINVLPVLPSSGFTVPLNITNSQQSSVLKGTQVMIKIDPALLFGACGPMCDSANISGGNWAIVNRTTGVALYAWMESNTTIWIKLDTGIGPVSSDNGLALAFYNISQYTNQYGYTGEAAQLSALPGQYDNGAQVFNVYRAGTGFLLPISSGGLGTAYDADVESNEYAWQSAGYYYDQYNSSASTDNLGKLVYWGCGFIYVGGTAGGCPSESTLPSTGYSIFTIIPTSPTQLTGYENYGNKTVVNVTNSSINYVGNKNLNGYMYFLWSRLRIAPPGGIMPNVTLHIAPKAVAPVLTICSQTLGYGQSCTINATATGIDQINLTIGTLPTVSGTGSVNYSVPQNGPMYETPAAGIANVVSCDVTNQLCVSNTITISKTTPYVHLSVPSGQVYGNATVSWSILQVKPSISSNLGQLFSTLYVNGLAVDNSSDAISTYTAAYLPGKYSAYASTAGDLNYTPANTAVSKFYVCASPSSNVTTTINQSQTSQTILITNQSKVAISSSNDNITINANGPCPLNVTMSGKSDFLRLLNGTISLTVSGSSDNVSAYGSLITSETLTGSKNSVPGAVLGGNVFSISGSSDVIKSAILASSNSYVYLNGSKDNVSIRMLNNSLVSFFVSGGSNKLYLYNGTVYLSVSGSSDSIYTYNTIVTGNSITGSKDYVYSN